MATSTGEGVGQFSVKQVGQVEWNIQQCAYNLKRMHVLAGE